MTKFEPSKKYFMFSVCDQDAKWFYTVSRRTDKSVWLTDDNGKTIRCRIKVHDNTEFVKPLGNYSMAPILKAHRLA